jgi:hypothetical protein
MTGPRLLTLVVLGIAVVVASALCEAKSKKRIHVTAQVVQTAFTGDLDKPQPGDQRITIVDLFDENGAKVGTGVGVCTLVSILPDTLQQCLLTSVFAEGHIIFGGLAPLPEVEAVAKFGILGGTDDFSKARGEAILVVTPTGDIDSTFDLD